MNKLHIETTRINIRLFTDSNLRPDDYNDLQPFVSNMITEILCRTESDTQESIDYVNSKNFDISKPWRLFTIERKLDSKCIGYLYINERFDLYKESELGCFIADEYQNQGFGTEAVKAIIWWMFEKSGENVVSVMIKTDNFIARRIIEKLGFVYVDRKVMPDENNACQFDHFRLYRIDSLSGAEWDAKGLYMCQPEHMEDFFRVRAESYNEHVLFGAREKQYQHLGSHIPITNDKLRILDIGCGTGVELSYIWEKAPNAHITCLDLSQEMLTLLLENYKEHYSKITIVKASYFDWQYPSEVFDIVVSSQTMHHFMADQKIEVYRNLQKTLKSGGIYLENDFYMDSAGVKQYQQRYNIIMSQMPQDTNAGVYHIDIPFTIETQCQLLIYAGFRAVDVLEQQIRPRGSGGILKAQK